jgi:chromosome segregation ATPase
MTGNLPSGRIPTVGMREIVAALHRRRARRRETVTEMRHALEQLSSGVERHLARMAQLKEAVEAQGGDLSSLQYYDNVMARLRGELRSAERALAEVFRAAADGLPAGT